MKTIPSDNLIRFYYYLFRHKKIWIEAQYEKEVDGWFCERCNHIVIEKQY